ncbi:MAG TPA: hypothetical protein DCM51_03060 [Actinobacteria bacterium]|nr:hypothetical protein [Actinomycetota bacterium]
MGQPPNFWFSILILIHLLLLTFWLGGDLGTYYSSRQVTKPELSVDARRISLKIMAFCDMGPRLCMPLFLASGTLLIVADPLGEKLRWAAIPVVLFTAVWVALVLIEHNVVGDKPLKRVSLRLDYAARIAVVIGTVGTGTATVILGGKPFGVESNPRWLGLKIALYGLTVLCGLLIRLSLKPFPAGFMALVKDGSTEAAERAIGGSMARATPFVYVIWALVITIAWLGVAKPGATL